ncbi:MAG: ABC transporter substrate-binding protein [Telluria sp.]|nr:ABC transporter substrate-binding protein [Telluria sp.]
MNNYIRGFLSILPMTVAAFAHAQQTTAPGLTDTSIKIGVSAPMSGATAALGAIASGIELKVKAVNAAGGVKMADGKTRKIELVILDDAFEPQRTLTNVRKMVEGSGVFAVVGTAGTQQSQVLKPYLSQHSVPNLFVYSAVYEWGDETANPWTIGLVPSFSTEAAIYAQYLKGAKPSAKVGLLYVNTDMGLNFQAGFKSAIAGSNISVVATQPTTPTDPTVDTQLNTLKASGADTLLIVTQPKQGAQAIRFAKESGWNPITIVSYAASSMPALKAAGFENAKGIHTAQFLKPITSYPTDAGVLRYLGDYQKYEPRFDKGDNLGQVGYTTGEALVQVLQSMKQPTRRALMDAARNMSAVDLSLLLPGISLTTKAGNDSFPIESLSLFQFNGQDYGSGSRVISFEGKTPKQR